MRHLRLSLSLEPAGRPNTACPSPRPSKRNQGRQARSSAHLWESPRFEAGGICSSPNLKSESKSRQRSSTMSAQTKSVQPTVVNGINVDDLFALIEGVRRDPAKGKTNWHCLLYTSP